NSNENTVERNTISNIDRGVEVRNITYGNKIKINRISNVDSGIYLIDSDESQISENDISNIKSSGINLLRSDNCVIQDNAIYNNAAILGSYGIYLHTSNNNNITNNRYDSNKFGMRIHASNSNKFVGNIVENNTIGGIHIAISDLNIFKENTIQNNGCNNPVTCSYGIESSVGVYGPGNNNIFYRNNLINNLPGNAYDEGVNQWDGGSATCGGNYWSNYSPACADVDNNGICDIPFAIPPLYTTNDNFPFKDLITTPPPAGCP
ncbi:MAG: NosD domain-containing protein, partial [bacterium]